MAAGVPARLETERHEEIPTALAPVLPPQHDSQDSLLRGQGVHARALRNRAYWSEVGRTLGCPACETPSLGKSHTLEFKTCQHVWEESGRTATAEEVKRGVAVVPDTRTLDPSSSSTDLNLKRLKPTTANGIESWADQMDEDTSLRRPATSHPL